MHEKGGEVATCTKKDKNVWINENNNLNIITDDHYDIHGEHKDELVEKEDYDHDLAKVDKKLRTQQTVTEVVLNTSIEDIEDMEDGVVQGGHSELGFDEVMKSVREQGVHGEDVEVALA